ncbi:prepilin-type N-terminal cleavage/methylation domain-containing protein [Deinococcus ruber]|uniref:Prepilin-type N-terminal cleavage/methylation domain-containing protein n=1 Tax=Deinococcus ruber TaxID=1848197 RepID=A0A918FDA3_9DEIO|nr:prepilin-type N-terminal cleavage/methylation domain-containing protein [Deinococcus ruber]GGR32627.1 hypothetical protein GCM10008957_48860 [Deinococcus ruber]
MNHPPPSPARTRRQRGFTLIEVLIASVLGVLIITALVAFLPKGVSQAASRSTDATAMIHVTQLVQMMQEQFRTTGPGGFGGFVTGTSQAFEAVMLTGGMTYVPLQQDIHAQTTLTIPDLQAHTGDDLLMVAANGVSKVEHIVGHPDANTWVVDCPTGLPSNGDILAYPAHNLKIDLSSGSILRHFQGRTTNLGSASGLSWAYLYTDENGHLVRNPAGTPAAIINTPSGKLTLNGLLPIAVDQSTRIDDAALIGLRTPKITRVLGCTEMGLVIPNEAKVKVTVLGEPSGATADVTVHGPDAAVDGQHPTVSTDYAPVKPGEYSLTANTITAGGEQYTPLIGGSPAKLFDTFGTIYLQAKYEVTTGGFVLNVIGLPNGRKTSVSVRGPSNATQPNLSSGGYDVHGLLPGSYVISGTSVNVGGITYSAPSMTLDITPGLMGSATLTFSPPASSGGVPTPPTPTVGTGTLRIQVSGLNGQSAIAQLNGATSYSTSLSDGTTTISDLAVGNYVITPDTTSSAQPQYPSMMLAIKDGQVTTISITYVSTGGNTSPPPVNSDVGSLMINVNGLEGHEAQATLSGPSNLNLTLADGTVRVDYLPVGDYTLLPRNSGSYAPLQTSYSIHISKDQLQTVSVTYRNTAPKGNIILHVIGLPLSTNTVVKVTGPATVQMNSSSTITDAFGNNIPTGTYSVVAPNAVNANGVMVTPGVSPGQSFVLHDGDHLTVTVNYVGNSNGGGSSGEPPDPKEAADCRPGYSKAYCADPRNNLQSMAPGYHPDFDTGSDPPTNMDGSPAEHEPPSADGSSGGGSNTGGNAGGGGTSGGGDTGGGTSGGGDTGGGTSGGGDAGGGTSGGGDTGGGSSGGGGGPVLDPGCGGANPC